MKPQQRLQETKFLRFIQITFTSDFSSVVYFFCFILTLLLAIGGFESYAHILTQSSNATASNPQTIFTFSSAARSYSMFIKYNNIFYGNRFFTTARNEKQLKGDVSNKTLCSELDQRYSTHSSLKYPSGILAEESSQLIYFEQDGKPVLTQESKNSLFGKNFNDTFPPEEGPRYEKRLYTYNATFNFCYDDDKNHQPIANLSYPPDENVMESPFFHLWMRPMPFSSFRKRVYQIKNMPPLTFDLKLPIPTATKVTPTKVVFETNSWIKKYSLFTPIVLAVVSVLCLALTIFSACFSKVEQEMEFDYLERRRYRLDMPMSSYEQSLKSFDPTPMF